MWYGVRCLFKHHSPSADSPTYAYEDRIIVVQADDANEALAKAEKEGYEYCSSIDTEWLGFVESFEIASETIDDFTEVYSHIHETSDPPDVFVDRFDDRKMNQQ